MLDGSGSIDEAAEHRKRSELVLHGSGLGRVVRVDPTIRANPGYLETTSRDVGGSLIDAPVPAVCLAL